jgi:Cu2+-exporting ATPase
VRPEAVAAGEAGGISEVPAPECYHCGLPVPAGSRFRAEVLGGTRDFCCAGCEAVAGAITAAGLEDYYRLRTASAAMPPPRVDQAACLFDREEVQETFVRRRGSLREVSLLIGGVRCAACLWLNERTLRALPGVVEASVRYPEETARVVWDPSRTSLTGILEAVRRIGYEARPFDPSHRLEIEPAATRRDPARLVFAGALGMMVMNLAAAAYFAGGPDSSGRLALWETFARWCELAATVVLLAYPGQDFFAGAWRDLRRRRIGMDVPIAAGLLAAWAGSARATLAGAGPVYFDAIAMLVFFVLLARAFETRARLSAAAVLDRFAAVVPSRARRVEPDGSETEIAALELAPGNIVRIRPGEVAPADGILEEGNSTFEEGVLTGEPWPRPRGPGDEIAEGSGNREQPVLVRVTRAGGDSSLGEIRRLLARGLAGRPPSALLADRLAGWLAAAVLAVAAVTAAWWAARNPAVALPATIAVLVVTCPCALALAAPLALAVAAGRLAQIGVLPARLSRLERLAGADTVAFDKTGTLTLAQARLENVRTDGELGAEEALAIASALESDSPHPIGQSLREAAVWPAARPDSVAVEPGRGIAGVVGGRRWWIGSPDFAFGPPPVSAGLGRAISDAGSERLSVVLTDRESRSALFTFEERLRPGADAVVGDLRRSGVRHAALLSGDSRRRVERLGRELGFDEARGAMTAADKLGWIQRRGRRGAGVLFVGDGLNDSPTLAAAGVSVSFGAAPQLSKLASDFVILDADLGALAAARRIARRARRLLAGIQHGRGAARRPGLRAALGRRARDVGQLDPRRRQRVEAPAAGPRRDGQWRPWSPRVRCSESPGTRASPTRPIRTTASPAASLTRGRRAKSWSFCAASPIARRFGRVPRPNAPMTAAPCSQLPETRAIARAL